MLSRFSKILQKAMYDRTTKFLNNHSVCSPTQHGKSHRTQRSIKYLRAKLCHSIPEYMRNYSFPVFKKKYKIILLSYAE